MISSFDDYDKFGKKLLNDVTHAHNPSDQKKVPSSLSSQSKRDSFKSSSISSESRREGFKRKADDKSLKSQKHLAPLFSGAELISINEENDDNGSSSSSLVDSFLGNIRLNVPRPR